MERQRIKMAGLKKIIFLLLTICVFNNLMAQSPVDTSYSEDFKPGRLGLVAGGGGLFYGGMLTGLATVWYEDNHWIGLHVKNDNAGWMQIDKYGHAFTTYAMGKLGMNAMRLTGVKRKRILNLHDAAADLFADLDIVSEEKSAVTFGN